MIWLLHNIFSVHAAKFWVMFPLYWTKNLGLRSFLLKLLIVLRCCSFLRGFDVTFSFVTILSNVALTILDDHPVGYLFSVQISWHFLRATSKDCESPVALKIRFYSVSPPQCFLWTPVTNYMLLYSTLIFSKIVAAPGVQSNFVLTKLWGPKQIRYKNPMHSPLIHIFML